MTVRKERVTNLFEVGHELYDNTCLHQNAPWQGDGFPRPPYLKWHKKPSPVIAALLMCISAKRQSRKNGKYLCIQHRRVLRRKRNQEQTRRITRTILNRCDSWREKNSFFPQNCKHSENMIHTDVAAMPRLFRCAHYHFKEPDNHTGTTAHERCNNQQSASLLETQSVFSEPINKGRTQEERERKWVKAWITPMKR